MGVVKACRYCGKEMPKGSLFRHEHVMCEQRPSNGNGAKPTTVHVRTNGKRVPPKTAVATETMVSESHKMLACDGCCFRGLDRAIDQELVRRAVVGGMSLEAACTFVREAKAALAG